MKITLIGAGCGPDTLTEEARRALTETQLALGSKRLLETYAEWLAASCETVCAVAPQKILDAITRTDYARACVLLSGDSGFYSGARRLLPLLAGQDVRVLPGVSSLQLLAARLGRSWQDWTLCSAHGVGCDVLSAICGGKPVFFLTGGGMGPAEICRTLTEAGLGELTVTVGEALGSAEERVLTGRAGDFTEQCFSALNVVLAEAAPHFPARAPGLSDELFERAEKIPMTKQEVRATALSKLGVGPEDTCWDVGAGTGSVSVEMALHARSVWAVERSGAALEIAEKNRKKFGVWNLRLLDGEAPDALTGLPAPDKVFVGGTGGRMREVLRAVHAANPKADICASVITLESLHQTYTELEALGYVTEITQVAVSRGRTVGGMHMMLAQNPVYLIVGRAK